MTSFSVTAVVLAVIVAASVVTGIPVNSDCSYIDNVFSMKNISSQSGRSLNNGSSICTGSKCCSPSEELLLQKSVMSDLHQLLGHNFHAVQNVLASSSDSLARVLEALVDRSRNKTMHIFLEVYEKMGSFAEGPVTELYSSLWQYLQRGLRRPPDIPTTVPSGDGPYLESLVHKFFGELFPLVYYQAIHPKAHDFSESFKTCLKNNVMEIKPFGKIPETMAKEVASSFEAAKVLLEALSLGMEVVERTNRIIESNKSGTDSCRKALLRLYYCPKCQGLRPSLKPCNGYCLNVMRGCLTQIRATDLDLPWSNFLSETMDLVREMRTLKIPSVNNVLENLYIPVSDAIMVGSLEGPRIQRVLNSVCGHIVVNRAENVDNSVHPPALKDVSVTTSPSHGADHSPFWSELDDLRDSMDRSKAAGFYANLAEVLCSDESFAETRDTSDCWNGHHIGEYTKELVRPGLDAQKYNPEMKWDGPAADADIEEMAETLRHMRQLVSSRLSPKWAPEAESQVAYDGSGGSGDGRVDSDDDGYSDPDDGSGSGDGETRSFMPPDTNSNPSKPKTTGSSDTGGAVSLSATSVTILSSSALLILFWSR